MSNDPMLEMFIFESMQLTERLEEILIEGDRGGLTEEHINEIFRVMHTIKGSAGMMEYTNIESVGHAVEDMFFYIRENSGVNPDWRTIVDICLESADYFKQEIAKIQAGLPSDGSETELLHKIHSYMDVLTGKAAPPPADDEDDDTDDGTDEDDDGGEDEDSDEDSDDSADGAEPEAPAAGGKFREALAGEHCYQGVVFFEDGCKMENIRAYQITNTLSDYCSRVDSVPADLLADCCEEIIEKGATFFMYTKSDMDTIRSILAEALFVKSFEVTHADAAAADNAALGMDTVALPSVAEDPSLEPEPVPAPVSAPAAKPAKPAKKKKQKADAAASAGQPAAAVSPAPEAAAAPVPVPAPEPTAPPPVPVPAGPTAGAGVSAPAEVKQNFISVNVEKLDRLMDLAGELVISVAMVVNNSDLEGLNLENFEKSAGLLNKNTSELQDVIMSVRMIPISSTFHKMHRLARDLSRKLNKDLEFTILGEETEVDKNIIDNLSDPLMHIIRNSMDHGLESAEEREAAGKDRTGHIVLEARNSGSDIIITCSDDGRGLNRDKILSKAIAQGMLTKPENEYTDKEIYNFVMQAGFSTKDAVTELSGRGVGMDVAKKNIEKIGGTVMVDSTPGQGAVNTIRIPLTLAILAGIEIRVGKNVYLVPTLNIRESFKPQPEQIVVDPDGNEMILFRGECYPIVRLHSLFSVHSDITSFEEGIIMMVEDEGHMSGLFADTLIGEQQVVLKAIPQFITERIGQIRGIAGCTILGNGNISLIIDVKSLTS